MSNRKKDLNNRWKKKRNPI